MELPENWRLGRLQNGCRTLFYKDEWAERIPVDECFQENIQAAIDNPNPRLYPALYRDSVLSREDLTSEQGIRNLVKTNLLTPEEALQICPKIKAWLKRCKLWSDPSQDRNQIRVGKYIYMKKGRFWYKRDPEGVCSPLPRKTHFQSVWEARVAFAKGEVTLEQVAEYSWGAIFEVVGDQMQLLPDYEDETLVSFREIVLQSIQDILDIDADIVKFTLSESQVWEPVYRIEPIQSVPNRKKLFFELLDKVLRCEISGYGARLTFNNAHATAIYFEQRRWDTCSTVYIPYLVNKQEKLDSMTLEEARTYVQKHQTEMITIGFTPADCKITAFVHKGNRYGLHLDTGKIFSMVSEESKYIPKNFDEWSDVDKQAYLGDDYDSLKDEYCKRIRACRKLYYYLKTCQGVSSKKAWEIATKKHRRLTADFAKRKRAACRWNCYHANETAQVVVICLPLLHWEVSK